MATINDPVTPTNVATVKPASTAAASTDLPLVVTLHPSSVAPAQALTTATGVGGAYRISPWGEQRVQLASSQLLVDTFDSGPIDTTNIWSAPTTGGAGTAFAFSTASMTGGSGTTANGFSMIASQAAFQPSAPGFLDFQTNINIEFPVLLNAVRFWGLATAPGSPTAALPLTNAMGFFVDTAGKMWAVSYQSGTRVNVQDLSSSGNNKQPLDSSAHKYYVYIRGDVGYWCIDDRDNVVATMATGAQGPDVTSLPIRFLTVAGAVGPSSSALLVVNAVVLGDTAGNNISIGDPTFPWRQATVKAPSVAVQTTDSALVVTLSPNSNTAINIGQVAGNNVGTAAVGVQKIGIVGNAGASFDGAIAAAPPANALQIGAKAATANPVNATAGNAVALMADKAGRLVISPGHVRDLVGVQTTNIAASVAETTIITAGAAGVFNDLSALIITTTNAAAATITVKDATAGTTRMVFDFPPAAATPADPIVIPFPVAVPQAVAANNWTATVSVNAGSVKITAVFLKNT